MKRSSVVRSRRFQELIETSVDTEITSAFEISEMTFLGERLADAAFQRLPRSVRRSAATWAISDDGARRGTCMLYDTLVNWQYKWTPAQRDQTICAESVLPLKYSLGAQNRVRPNCLGIAQAMAGYARNAGAEYVIVDTLRRYDVERTTGMYVGHVEIDASLEQYQYFSGVRRYRREVDAQRKLFERDLGTILSPQNASQAHHAMMIKVPDEVLWRFVDPYMHRLYNYELEANTKAILANETDSADTALYKFHPFIEDVFQGTAELVNAALRTFEELAVKSFRPVDYEFLEAWIDLATVYITIKADEIRENRTIIGVVEQDPINILPAEQLKIRFYEEVIGPFMTAEERERADAGALSTSEAYGLAVGRSGTKRRRNQALNRFLRLFLRYTYELQVEAYELVDVHPLVEINAAECHLAAMTVNHLSVVNNVDPSDLIRYRPYSQFTVRGTMADIQNSTDARAMKAYACGLDYLRGIPRDNVLPALHRFL